MEPYSIFHLDKLFAKDNVVTIKKTAKNSAGDVEYIGLALRGSADSDPAWRIVKIFYDSNGEYDYELVSPIGTRWDQRTTATYE